MKKLLLTAAAILATLNMYGQGQGVIGFSSAGTAADNRVYVTDDASTPYMSGTPAAGAAYNIAFFWTTVGGNQWTQIGAPIAFLTGTGAGQWLGGNRTISGLPTAGAVLDIKAQAWETAFGNSYDAVRASGGGHLGESSVVTIKSKDPGNSLETVPTLTSAPTWSGFALTPVPEPSTIALGLVGVGALLMLRRRK
jgi:hypothetical protein